MVHHSHAFAALFGVGLLNMPLTDYGMRELPPELAGHGSSMLNWCKQIASVIWLSMLTALLTISTRLFQQSGIEAMQASMSGVNTVFFSPWPLLWPSFGQVLGCCFSIAVKIGLMSYRLDRAFYKGYSGFIGSS